MTEQFEAMRFGDVNGNTPIWRYLTRGKFENLLRLRALWFSKLSTLRDDPHEGLAPAPARFVIEQGNQQMAQWFTDPNHQQQVRSSFQINERDGRELLVVSCWTTNDPASGRMWEVYAPGPDSVAIESTVASLASALPMSHPGWHIGKVTYVDMERDTSMSSYRGHQAHERAFQKGLAYAWEREIRVCTSNFVGPGCLNPDGTPQTPRQQAGYVYEPGRLGLYATIELSKLVTTFHSAPNAQAEHHAATRQLLADVGITVSCEELGW